jgi:hypothetical protein
MKLKTSIASFYLQAWSYRRGGGNASVTAPASHRGTRKSGDQVEPSCPALTSVNNRFRVSRLDPRTSEKLRAMVVLSSYAIGPIFSNNFSLTTCCGFYIVSM